MRFLRKIWNNIFPTILSSGTVFSSAGTSLFGTQRIFDYIYGFFFNQRSGTVAAPDLSAIPDWANVIRIGTYIVVITSNVIIMVDTRCPAIFREYRKNTRIEIEEDNIRRQLTNTNIIAELLNSHRTELSLNADPENLDHENGIHPKQIASLKITVQTPTLGPGTLPVTSEPIIQKESFVFVGDEERNPEDDFTLYQKVIKAIVSTVLKAFGLSSITFSALNTYLGSITLFEFIGGNPAEQGYNDSTRLFLQGLMYSAASITVISKFYSGYSYVFPATKKSADALGLYCAGINRIEGGRPISRCEDAKKYAITLLLSSFNIVSSPYLAFWSTQQTLKRIPYINDYEDFIFWFSAFSTITSFANDITSKSPAVRNIIEAWWFKKETDFEKIQELFLANLWQLMVLNSVVYGSGIIDSLATGANILVAVVNTSASVFGLDKYGIELFAFALLCGISATFVNFAFSVRRGHHDFLKNEVWDYCKLNHLLKNEGDEFAGIDIEETFRRYEITQLPDSEKIDEIDTDLENNKTKPASVHSVQEHNGDSNLIRSNGFVHTHTETNGFATSQNGYGTLTAPKTSGEKESVSSSLQQHSLFKNVSLRTPKVKAVKSPEEILNTALAFI